VIVRILRDAASGILHIHLEGLLHRDIAARNILVTHDYRGLVSDFGLAREPKGAYHQSASSIFPVRWTSPVRPIQAVFAKYLFFDHHHLPT
jgi:serine/threonine protein kinase